MSPVEIAPAAVVFGGDQPSTHLSYAIPSPVDRQHRSLNLCTPCVTFAHLAPWPALPVDTLHVSELHAALRSSNIRKLTGSMLRAGRDVGPNSYAPEVAVVERRLTEHDMLGGEETPM